MTKAMWKFDVDVSFKTVISMPKDAKILCVQIQHGTPCIWAIVNPNNGTEDREFTVKGTGHSFDDSGKEYIGTFQLSAGDFVGHLFEVKS